MAVFEYSCCECGANFERRGAYSDVTPFCAVCGGASRQVISAPFFVFKGTGFYQTDYKSKENGEKNGSK